MLADLCTLAVGAISLMEFTVTRTLPEPCYLKIGDSHLRVFSINPIAIELCFIDFPNTTVPLHHAAK